MLLQRDISVLQCADLYRNSDYIAIIGTLTNFNLIEMLNGSMAVDNAGIGVHADAGKGMVVAGYVKLLAGQCITDAIYSVIFFFVTTWFLKNKFKFGVKMTYFIHPMI